MDASPSPPGHEKQESTDPPHPGAIPQPGTLRCSQRELYGIERNLPQNGAIVAARSHGGKEEPVPSGRLGSSRSWTRSWSCSYRETPPESACFPAGMGSHLQWGCSGTSALFCSRPLSLVCSAGKPQEKQFRDGITQGSRMDGAAFPSQAAGTAPGFGPVLHCFRLDLGKLGPGMGSMEQLGMLHPRLRWVPHTPSGGIPAHGTG